MKQLFKENIIQNWFDTLNAALESEGLVDLWPLGLNISYGENARVHTECGKLISVFRENNGKYERPIHYNTQRKKKKVAIKFIGEC